MTHTFEKTDNTSLLSHLQHHEWLAIQDRDQKGQHTPRWRGVTLLHELRSHSIPVAIASDNTRDQFYAYGDLDMLEVFNQVRRSTNPCCNSSMPNEVVHF